MLTGTGLIERIYRSADAVVVELAAEVKPVTAKQFVTNQLRWLAKIAEECDRPYTLIKHPGIKPRKVPASMATPAPSEYDSILMPNLIGQIPLTPAFFRALDIIMVNPEDQWFLHRITPGFERQTQIAVSESAASLIVGATPLQATGRSRLEYMPQEEFDRMSQTFRRELSEDRFIRFGFDLFSPVTGGNWRHVEYEYQAVGVLPGGDILQLGRCRSCVGIPDRILK